MEPIELYNKFDQEFFYSFHKHSTDLELEELGKRYRTCLRKHEGVINDILKGERPPGELKREVRSELEFLAVAEAKFPIELPHDLGGEHFEIETEFQSVEGPLRGMIGGRTHLVRLIKPAEYDRNYWFYTEGHSPPQNVFCSEFGLDLIEYLKAVRVPQREKLNNLRRALAYQHKEVLQFWTLAPYLHFSLMNLGYSWSQSITTVIKIASRRFYYEGQPYTGVAHHQLGYDERMPSHLLARMAVMRDVALLKRGEYARLYKIEFSP